MVLLNIKETLTNLTIGIAWTRDPFANVPEPPFAPGASEKLDVSLIPFNLAEPRNGIGANIRGLMISSLCRNAVRLLGELAACSSAFISLPTYQT
jgi:hypothetical protein